MTGTGQSPFAVIGDADAGVCESDTSTVKSDPTKLRTISFSTAAGATSALSDYSGDVVLIVNVASKCGLTPQYEGMQRLYTEKSDRGLSVLGFPANNFMGQEPGTDAEIAEFCSINYAVTFPIMAKISVVGQDLHPLYAELTRQAPTAPGKAEMREVIRSNGGAVTEDPDVLWNFEKFLIGRDGAVLARFAPGVTADDPVLLSAIDAALDVPDVGRLA
jgi:glutathione peroxidase